VLGSLRYARRLKPEIVHTHRIEIGFFATFFWRDSLRIQFIHNEASKLRLPASSSFWKHFKTLHKIIERYTISKAEKVFVFNSSESKRLASSYRNINRAYTWYDPSIFFRRNAIAKNRKDKKSLRVIWVGRFESEKNPEMVIDIARILKNSGVIFEIRMVGTGSRIEHVKKMIIENQIGEQVVCLGSLSSAELSFEYSSADLFISTSFYEGSPTT
jgi:glycosyltransferase involved in cell wall biosynthesis